MRVEPDGQAAIRTQLDRITESESFRSSQLLTRFLRFTVEQTLAGETDSIKESVLGLEVCGRTRFDPRYDSVVRTTASRLRTKLSEYYEAHPEDQIRIDYPRGSYVPHFGAPVAAPELSESPSAPWTTRRAWISAAAAVVALGATVAGYFFVLRSSAKPQIPVTRRFHVAYPPNARPGPLTANGLSRISPDGKKIAVSLRDSDDALSGIWITILNPPNGSG